MVIPGVGTVTWTYVRDPEGNIIELQRRDAACGQTPENSDFGSETAE